MRTLRALMIAQLILLVVALIGVGVLLTRTPDLPACPTEDSDNCVWDGHGQGDGTGASFVALHGLTYYLTEH